MGTGRLWAPRADLSSTASGGTYARCPPGGCCFARRAAASARALVEPEASAGRRLDSEVREVEGGCVSIAKQRRRFVACFVSVGLGSLAACGGGDRNPRRHGRLRRRRQRRMRPPRSPRPTRRSRFALEQEHRSGSSGTVTLKGGDRRLHRRPHAEAEARSPRSHPQRHVQAVPGVERLRRAVRDRGCGTERRGEGKVEDRG